MDIDRLTRSINMGLARRQTLSNHMVNLFSNPNIYKMTSIIPYVGLGASAYAGNRLGKWLARRRAVPPTTKNVTRLAKRVSRIERGKWKEKKTHDVNADASYGTTATLVPLSEIAQGDTSLTREGLQIRPKFMQFKGSVLLNPSATTTMVRLIIFRDTENHGAYPTALDLLESADTYSWKEHDTRPRFKIYRDKSLTVHDSKKFIVFKGILKFGKNMRINYGGTSAAETSNGRNSLFALIVANDNTNQPYVVFRTRLRFTE